MPDTELRADITELLQINRTLAGLIEPLQAILAMEQAPGIGDRLDTLMADLMAIREQMQRAADAMEETLTRRQQDREREDQTASTIAAMQKDIQMLKKWFCGHLPEAEETF